MDIWRPAPRWGYAHLGKGQLPATTDIHRYTAASGHWTYMGRHMRRPASYHVETFMFCDSWAAHYSFPLLTHLECVGKICKRDGGVNPGPIGGGGGAEYK